MSTLVASGRLLWDHVLAHLFGLLINLFAKHEHKYVKVPNPDGLIYNVCSCGHSYVVGGKLVKSPPKPKVRNPGKPKGGGIF